MKFTRQFFAYVLVGACCYGCAQMDQVQSAKATRSKFDGAVYKGTTTFISDNKDGIEEFRVFHQAPSGFSEVAHVQASATAEAIRFCGMRNMRAVFFSETISTPPHVLGNFPRAEVVFGCAKN